MIAESEDKRVSRKRALFFIIVGIAVLAVPFLCRVRDREQAEQYIEEIEVTEDEEDTKEEVKTGTGKKKASKEDIPEGAIGIIEIESLDLRYPIFEGAGNVQLNAGIGHLPESAGLLEEGNCVLAGHNGSRRGTFFTNLSRIQAGARVVVTSKEKVSHTYEVVDTTIVGPYDASVREKSDKECLTLFTCAYHGTRRFVCRCRLVAVDEQIEDKVQ